MRRYAREERIVLLLQSAQRFAVFFLLVGFIVSCCMMLFVSSMVEAMNLTLTEDGIQHAAKLTMGNVVLLTTLLTLLDTLRRRYMIRRPVNQILSSAQRIMEGDFDARIPPMRSIDRKYGFDEIAQCLNKMAQELSSMETLRTDFIANVSHELKTPLTVIKNYAVMLEQPGLDEETRKEYARAIADTSRRLANLITNILKLNKLENQQIFPVQQSYDLGEQLCECLLGFEEAWESKQLEIETVIEEGVMVCGDAELLSLVWNNLFSNAIKFTDKGGCVSLSLKSEANVAVVKVADTGCGFGAEIGAHIFEKFYQGDSSRAMQGNGLGLALVRRVVDIVGGDIAVESEIGRGSVFTVRIRREAHGAV